ncbi:motility associated factor glycosyltransferase family protein [Bacillus sp. FJAT-45350]|uniref:motility associated factor glycosyltransferase family protein n=1 Tax=Bacillus sp. FJAT-45350 TaxID=2011014 RepID=UPI000BB8D435|nr:6-hydroxymethylpterin diphosphokinase MptE-like protein [Bacillus sp. FJAT-45350]
MEKNYQLLQEKNKPLFDLIVRDASSDGVQPIRAKNGEWVLKVSTLDNREIYSNSKYDPKSNIKKLLEPVDFDSSVIMCIGLGMGYEVKEIIARKAKGTKVLILEPNLNILKMALEYNDLEEVLSSNYVFLAGGNLENIKYQLKVLKGSMMYFLTKSPEMVFLPYGLKVYDQTSLKEIIYEMKNTVVAQLKGVGNSVEDTLLGINHTFSNMEHILDSPNIFNLEKLYKGYPAICVAAGPSLEKNIDMLREVQDKALIFCADTIYEKLLDNGIVADGISIIERPKKVYNILYKGKSEVFHENTALLANMVVYPKILQEYPGVKVIYSRTGTTFDRSLGESIPSLNNLDIGQSCAHVSFATAKALKCDPIILLGQDLAYGETGFTHARGTYAENNTESDNNGQETIFVTSYNQDNVVKTTPIWDMFRRWFESVIQIDGSFTYINATEGGAYIDGAIHMSFKEAIEKYLKESEPKKSFMESIKINCETGNQSNRKIATKFLNEELKTLKEVESKLDKIESNLTMIDRIMNKEIEKVKLKKAIRTFESTMTNLHDLFEHSLTFKQIIQPLIVQLVQFVQSNTVVKEIKEFEVFYQYVLSKTLQIKELLKMTIKEYERGLKILRTGVVDTIDTPWMGEMYED